MEASEAKNLAVGTEIKVVAVKDRLGDYAVGDTLTVTYVSERGEWADADNDEGSSCSLWPTEFELAEPRVDSHTDLSVGDRVKVLDATYYDGHYIGEEGTVVEVEHEGYSARLNVKVKFAGRMEHWGNHGGLTKLEDTLPRTITFDEIQVGDKITRYTSDVEITGVVKVKNSNSARTGNNTCLAWHHSTDTYTLLERKPVEPAHPLDNAPVGLTFKFTNTGRTYIHTMTAEGWYELRLGSSYYVAVNNDQHVKNMYDKYNGTIIHTP